MNFIYRVRFKNYFQNGALLGSAGSKSKSGCKTNRDFVQFIEKFIGHVRPSINNKVVLFWDNHSCHLSIEAQNLAKDYGIIIVSFFPHCSHKRPPPDRSIFGTMKVYFNNYATSWMISNPKRSMKINNIRESISFRQNT